jgi:probable rRNA maturation factor
VKYRIGVRRETRSSTPTTALTAAARAALAQARSKTASLTIVLTDDGRMRRLNARFAGENHTTDVLAFPSDDVAGDPGYLGDVVISLPQARRQARRLKVPLLQELALLVVHGSLHLTGLDHKSAGERRRMWGIQSAALRRLSIDPDRLEVGG